MSSGGRRWPASRRPGRAAWGRGRGVSQPGPEGGGGASSRPDERRASVCPSQRAGRTGVSAREPEYAGGREPASGKGAGRGGGEARQCAGRAAGAASSFRPEVGRRDRLKRRKGALGQMGTRGGEQGRAGGAAFNCPEVIHPFRSCGLQGRREPQRQDMVLSAGSRPKNNHMPLLSSQVFPHTNSPPSPFSSALELLSLQTTSHRHPCAHFLNKAGPV